MCEWRGVGSKRKLELTCTLVIVVQYQEYAAKREIEWSQNTSPVITTRPESTWQNTMFLKDSQNDTVLLTTANGSSFKYFQLF